MKYCSNIVVEKRDFRFFDLRSFCDSVGVTLDLLPNSYKILLENILRKSGEDAAKFFLKESTFEDEIFFYPSRVLMQDFTGVPAIVDLAMIRDQAKILGKDPEKINPIIKTELVIDHSVQVDSYGSSESKNKNIKNEFDRNFERYKFLKWGQKNFDKFSVVPPGAGICHQINLENFATIVNIDEDLIYPDTVVGTDSHTTMINGLGVLGWGVGGIEAEIAMLGQPISMVKPRVFGVELVGKLANGVGAMDLVLKITNELRKKNVVGSFVEYFGLGIDSLSLEDRASIANMAPEYGATCGIFPVDNETLLYLEKTGRRSELIDVVEKYTKIQGLWRSDSIGHNSFFDSLTIDLSAIELCIAGPKRPQDLVYLSSVPESFAKSFPNLDLKCDKQKLSNGSVVLAAITSCTNTSNPESLIAAGLLAKKAVELGLKVGKYTKTSLSPGSKAAKEYLEKSGLLKYLEHLGFFIAGYGCMTCIGNSGPLNQEFESEIKENSYVVSAVISGNRNFEGRVHPLVQSNYLASPMLVVAYAILGNVNLDIANESLGLDKNGKNIYLKDIIPSKSEITEIVSKFVNKELYREASKFIFDGDENWQLIESEKKSIYDWPKSLYIEKPPYLDCQIDIGDILDAKILAHFGDSITTDHISPAGNISIKSPAGKYLMANGVKYEDFNSYGSRRGSYNVMTRGTFANIRIKNLLLDGVEGGMSISDNGEVNSIYDVAMENIDKKRPSVIFAGHEYGTGSSRDWAAKGTKLLGIRAVIAKSFERIHRSNLAGMGILPLELIDKNIELDLKKATQVNIFGIKDMSTKKEVSIEIKYQDSNPLILKAICRLDTAREIEYFHSGSIFGYILKSI
jgi:aconitate hydratase